MTGFAFYHFVVAPLALLLIGGGMLYLGRWLSRPKQAGYPLLPMVPQMSTEAYIKKVRAEFEAHDRLEHDPGQTIGEYLWIQRR